MLWGWSYSCRKDHHKRDVRCVPTFLPHDAKVTGNKEQQEVCLMMTKARNAQVECRLELTEGFLKHRWLGPTLERLIQRVWGGAWEPAFLPIPRVYWYCWSPDPENHWLWHPHVFLYLSTKSAGDLAAPSCCQASVIRSELGFQRPVLLFCLAAVWQVASRRTSEHLLPKASTKSSACWRITFYAQGLLCGRVGKRYRVSPQPERY